MLERKARNGIAALVAGSVVAAAGLAAAEPAPPSQAPKPARTAAGEPNWTGFWTPVGGLLDRNFGPGAVGGPPTATAVQTPVPAHPEIKPPYRAAYDKNMARESEGKVTSDPTALCLPPGMPRMMNATYGLEILQTPGQITMTSEWQAESRRIWLDGRKHPDPDEALPTYGGHSIGHWDGDTLVVDTAQLRGDVPLDQSGLPHSDAMRLTERLHQEKPGLLVDVITIDDPQVYASVWTITKRYRYRPELNLQEFVCTENNRNVGPNGEPVFK